MVQLLGWEAALINDCSIIFSYKLIAYYNEERKYNEIL